MDFFPLLSFLLLVFLLSARIVFLKRKGIRVGSGTGELSSGTILLYLVFLLVLLVFLFELVNQAIHLSFSLIPESITNPLVDSAILKILGFLVVIV